MNERRDYFISSDSVGRLIKVYADGTSEQIAGPLDGTERVMLNEGNITPGGALREMLGAESFASFPGFMIDPAVLGTDQTVQWSQPCDPGNWGFPAWIKVQPVPVPSPDRSGEFMADWLVFQAAEQAERDNALPAFPGSWPPKVGLEFPR